MILVGWGFPVIAQTPIISSTPDYYDSFVVERYIYYEHYNPCSCVSYAKYISGHPQSEVWGNAWEIKPLYQEPQEFGIIITRDGKGHIAYYERVGDTLYLYEANFVPCQLSTRKLSIDDQVIIGYR